MAKDKVARGDKMELAPLLTEAVAALIYHFIGAGVIIMSASAGHKMTAGRLAEIALAGACGVAVTGSVWHARARACVYI